MLLHAENDIIEACLLFYSPSSWEENSVAKKEKEKEKNSKLYTSGKYLTTQKTNKQKQLRQ